LPTPPTASTFPTRRSSDLSALKKSGHFPTLVTSFLYFDYSFMVWTLLGVLANQIAAPESLNLSAQQRVFMVSVPILFGGVFRLRSEEHTSELQSPYALVCR